MKKYLFSRIFVAGVCTAFLLTMSETASASASLNDYWIGNADWKYVTKWTESSLGDNTRLDGIHIEVVGNDWYLFTRVEPFSPLPKWGTEVRRSTNKGLDWGDPEIILEPEDGTPWAYAATDGQPCDDASDRPGFGWTEINTIETS